MLARPISDPAEIVRCLVAQVTGTVRWRESVLFMAQAGVTTFYEVGAGKVLTGLIKRIAGHRDGVRDRHARRRRPVQGRARLSYCCLRGRARRADVRSHRKDRAGDRRHRPHRRQPSPARCTPKARPSRISGTRREVLDQLAAELGERVHVLPCNLADAAETEALVPRAEEAMGQLDILVANAGVTRDNLLVQLRDEDWDQVIAINLSATFRLARAAVRGMMRRRFGRVIAITSVVGTTGNPGQANYVAAKAGITGMIKAMAQEYAKRGVTANCVAPGFIVTPMTDKLNDKQREVDPRENSGRPRRNDGGSRRRGRLSGLERGRLCDRADVACERRNGHDLKAIGPARAGRRPRWSTLLKCGNRTKIGLGEPECRRAGQQYPPLIGVDPRPSTPSTKT